MKKPELFAKYLETLNGTQPDMKTRAATVSGDSENEAAKSFQALMGVVEDFFTKNPQAYVFREQIIEMVNSKFDISQPAAPVIDTGVKTEGEARDLNFGRLTDHFADFYGPNAASMVMTLKQRFADLLFGTAYCDFSTGTLHDNTDNKALNKRISELKRHLVSRLIRYMEQQSPDSEEVKALRSASGDEDRRRKALSLFYRMRKDDTRFDDMLRESFRSVVHDTRREEAEEYWKNMIDTLWKDPDFYSFFRGRTKRRLSLLFNVNGSYSELVGRVEKWLEDNPRFIMRGWSEVRSRLDNNIPLFDACAAYTILSQFDTLLKDATGSMIGVNKDSAGWEFSESKYYYSNDTSHQRKDWQSSEDVSSEKHTALFTEALLNTIQVRDYRFGQNTQRRVTSTLFLRALNNLRTDVLSGYMKSDNSEYDSAFDELKTLIQGKEGTTAGNVQRMLELLFSKTVPGKQFELARYLYTSRVADTDWSVLKSVYDVVFNKDNPVSLWNLSIALKPDEIVSMGGITSVHRQAMTLVDEIAGYVCRNTDLEYLEGVFDYKFGEMVMQKKSKGFSAGRIRDNLSAVNAFANNMPETYRDNLLDEYRPDTEVKVYIMDDTSTGLRYWAVIGGQRIEVEAPNGNRDELFSKIDKNMFHFAQDEWFDSLNKVDIPKFAVAYFRDNNYRGGDENERRFYSACEFIQKTTGIKILSETGLHALNMFKNGGWKPSRSKGGLAHYMKPLLLMGMRSLYAAEEYRRAGGKNFRQHLKDTGNTLYGETTPSGYLFNTDVISEAYKEAAFRIVKDNDGLLEDWTDMQIAAEGQATPSTTRNFSGDSVPNSSVIKLGSRVQHYARKQQWTNMGSLMFATHPEYILHTLQDLECRTKNGDVVSVTDMSNQELIFHAIFNKFWMSYFRNNTVIIQPTEYSDKRMFQNYEVGNWKNSPMDMEEDQLLDEFVKTVGEASKKTYEETVKKLKKVTEEWAKSHGVDINIDYEDIMRMMSPDELTDTAARIGVVLELDKDYRVTKDSAGRTVTCINELMKNYAETYSDKGRLKEKLDFEKRMFVNTLLKSNCVFQVVSGGRTYGQCLSQNLGGRNNQDPYRPNNPVLAVWDNYIGMYGNKTGTIIDESDPEFRTFDNKTIGNLMSRSAVFMRWVDPVTGRLILAKQKVLNAVGATVVKNIVSPADFDPDADVMLNPLLNRFFMVENLLSNNLRLTLTGFETNHPAGYNSPLNKTLQLLRSNPSLEEFNSANAETLNETGFDAFKRALSTVTDLPSLRKAINNEEDVIAKSALVRLYDETVRYESNTSQYTQFKRNSIVSATLQTCNRGSIEGPPKKVKCAVIEDEKAPVFDYRGTRRKPIKGCDGAALITQFQCILENRSLGSQAVGFIKKPIWYDYDPSGGTSFMAKFATTTITNEAMRLFLTSKSDMHRTFRKMTNLQWGGGRPS